MTRDEAIARMQRLHDARQASASEVVDAFAEMGMLRFDGEDGANKEFSSALSCRGIDADKVFGALASRNLKIVRA